MSIHSEPLLQESSYFTSTFFKKNGFKFDLTKPFNYRRKFLERLFFFHLINYSSLFVAVPAEYN